MVLRSVLAGAVLAGAAALVLVPSAAAGPHAGIRFDANSMTPEYYSGKGLIPGRGVPAFIAVHAAEPIPSTPGL